jgi:hypothetical protein
MKRSVGSLAGKFFLSVKSADREIIEWQGQIKEQVSPGLYLLQLYEWLSGRPSDQVIVPVAEMVGWRFYDCAEDMQYAYRLYDGRRKSKEVA